jgi:tripartite-type tricarboxylate transporter receptor subunit TctC
MERLFCSARTPQPVVQRLNRELMRVYNTPDVQEQATASGTEVVGGRPKKFAAFIRSEIAKWGGIIKDAWIKLQ